MKPNTKLRILSGLIFIIAPLLYSSGVPDWIRGAAQLQLPSYKSETDAVVLLESRTVIPTFIPRKILVKGQRVVKILRQEGIKVESTLILSDNSDSKIKDMTGWRLDSNGKSEKFGFKSVFESDLDVDALYTDAKKKLLNVPDVNVGSVVGFEWEIEYSPYSMEDSFFFQDTIPVRRCLYTVTIPPRYECGMNWMNYAPVEPLKLNAESSDKTHTWEWQDIPPIEDEPLMPAYGAVQGYLIARFYLPNFTSDGYFGKWGDIGAWYSGKYDVCREADEAITAKAREIVSKAPDMPGKLRALADYIQKEIRYVAILIGDGGLQPHPASKVFANRYGDCKDKAALLSAMLKALGVESYYLLVNTNRGKVKPGSPVSLYSFNHAIVAIRLPAEVPDNTFSSVVRHPALGRLLIFDPTHPYTPLGQLPVYLQGNMALLSAGDKSLLLDLPLPPPENNLIERTGRFKLLTIGVLQGEIIEKRHGIWADDFRSSFQLSTNQERTKYMESFLGNFFAGAALQSLDIQNLMESDRDLIITYRFQVPNYAKNAGNFTVIRPCVLGNKSENLETNESAPRRYPIDLESAALHRDDFIIELPEGWNVNELPPGVTLEPGFAVYKSVIEKKDRSLIYKREYRLLEPALSSSKFNEVVSFFRGVNTDERQAALVEKK